VVFRILWGFAGSRTAQFASFVKGPGKTLAYLRTLPNRDPTDVPGHNPLGAWSVVAILLAIAAVVGLGLFTVDIDAFEGGPLSDRVSFDFGRRIAEWHELAFRVLQGLVVLHVAAVAYYLVWKRSNLITPMFTGRKAFRTDPGLSFAPLWRALLVALVAAAVAWWIAKGARF
jgi:cytochrome b